MKIALKLLKRKLGFRNLLDVIPLDATLVKGSHGLPPRDPLDGAMLATSEPSLLDADHIEPTDVMRLILATSRLIFISRIFYFSVDSMNLCGHYSAPAPWKSVGRN